MENRKIFICDCHNLEHQISFSYDKDEKLLYIEPHLIPKKNFLKRFYIGLKYIFGYRSKFGEFDEIILNNKKIKELLILLKK